MVTPPDPSGGGDPGAWRPKPALDTVMALALACILALPAASLAQTANGDARGWVEVGMGGGRIGLVDRHHIHICGRWPRGVESRGFRSVCFKIPALR
jgi:hypothetical protein